MLLHDVDPGAFGHDACVDMYEDEMEQTDQNGSATRVNPDAANFRLVHKMQAADIV